MQHIKNIIPKKLVSGLTGFYTHGTAITLSYVEIKAGSDIPGAPSYTSADHLHYHYAKLLLPICRCSAVRVF